MVIVMAGKKTFHSAQGDKLHPLRTDDIIVLAQTDSSALEGYRTVSSSLADAAKGVTNQIKIEGRAGIIVTDPTQGIIGDGRAATPIEVDSEYFNKNWVVNQYVNVTQVGNQTSQILPIIKGNGFNIIVGSDISVYLGGLNLTFLTQTINLEDYVTAPHYLTLYMYFTLSDSVLKMLITRDPRAERYDSTYIGTIKCGNAVIDSITTKPFMRVGNYRLSETIQGSAIPVTSGSPWGEEFTSWGGAGTLRSVNAGIDMARSSGAIIYDPANEYTIVNGYAEVYIHDLQNAIDILGGYRSTLVFGTQGYRSMFTLNGQLIWGSMNHVTTMKNISSRLREGINIFNFEGGDIKFFGPYLL